MVPVALLLGGLFGLGGLCLRDSTPAEETELEEEYGRYIYQVELRDAQNVQWDLELDATTGQVLQDHRDD